MTAAMDNLPLPPSIILSGAATLVFGAALAYVLFRSKKGGGKTDDNTDSSSNSKDLSSSSTTKNGVEPLDREKYPGGAITILFGSQTGTAESFSTQLQREGESHGFKIHVVDLEDVSCTKDVQHVMFATDKLDEYNRARAVFLVATYGEGESTDNAEPFVRLLKLKGGLGLSPSEEEEMENNGDDDGTTEIADPEYLSALDYCVFGLGNTQYEHYNAMGKFFDEVLGGKVGATRILELGLGDDDQDLEGDFETWKDNEFWPALARKYNKGNLEHGADAAAGTTNGTTNTNGTTTTTNGTATASNMLPDCPYAVEYLPEYHGQTPSSIPRDDIPVEQMHKSTRHYFTALDCPVTLSRELRNTEKDGGSTLHMEVDISSNPDQLKYQTADNLGILPVNEVSVVDAVAKALGYDLDDIFRFKPVKEGEDKVEHLFPTPCSVRECLSRYCDLTTPPRRSELKLLSRYATDTFDRKALERMSSKEGKSEYKEKVIDTHTGTAEIISKLCTSIHMPLEHFLAVCPRLQPRFYTISSSSSVHPHSVHITVSVMVGDKDDGSGEKWKGVCTNHLASLDVNKPTDGGTCRVFLRGSAFRLPNDPTRPIIMIGPGTGIAPMRALLQERSHQKHVRKLNVGRNVLYFGCKRRNEDFLYEEELRKFEKDGVLHQLHLAFSREQNQKVYVQHLLEKNATETWELIDKQNGSIYVCGGTKMGMDVTEAVTKIVKMVGGKDDIGAKSYVEGLRSQGRFVQELWS